MHWFGKFVLLPFNLIAAGAFVYFATQDWKGRQAIEASGLRHVLLIKGLPLGDIKADPAKGVAADPTALPAEADAEIPFRVEMAGGFITETVSKKLLEAYFQAAPGGTALGGANQPVPNQLAEVRRVKAKIDADLSGKDAAGKARLLGGWLLLQAETIEQRLAFQKLIADGNDAELEKALAARFAAVLDDPKPGETETPVPAGDADPDRLKDKVTKIDESRTPTLDAAERRGRLAHLLVHLSPDADWQKRVMVVVGLKEWVRVVGAQARRFEDMATRFRQQIPADQGEALTYTNPATGARETYYTGFRGQLNALERLARQRTELSADQAKIRAAWIEQKTKEDGFVAQRQTQLKAIEDQLRKIKGEVDEALVHQGNIEAGLFEVQREVAITLDEVYRLEAELAARERDLLGLPPLPRP